MSDRENPNEDTPLIANTSAVIASHSRTAKTDVLIYSIILFRIRKLPRGHA